MPILNMTYGQGNPYQPFHLNAISDLAVTGGDTEATITWTDPGNLVVDSQTLATWSSTKLVRKVGSAPSDSSDGTLVVNETVADTYAVNGYTDTGLTNGTTYYYGAFATATNGLETISNIESVTPAQGGWQPGANTLAYRPLTDDYDDYGGNGYNFNSNSTNLTTVDGVKCCDLASSYCDANITITTLPYTIAFYCKIKNPSARGINVLFAEGGGWGGSGVWASTSNIYIRYGNVTDTDQGWSFTPDGDWHLYVATFSATGGGLYIDGQLFQTLKNPQSDPDANGTPFYIGHDNGNQTFGNAYMGAVILEDKARSAQDVSDYYDLTKGDYGIS